MNTNGTDDDEEADRQLAKKPRLMFNSNPFRLPPELHEPLSVEDKQVMAASTTIYSREHAKLFNLLDTAVH